MSWHFLPGGLLMPAALPSLEIDKVEADPKFTRDGYFDLQVRGRVDSHLENFINEFMDPFGLDHSDIEYTPHMDYNVRFYCRKEDYAEAIKQQVLTIDYLKFKPTAEDKVRDENGEIVKDADGKGVLKYRHGPAYHSVLNSIWGDVCRLNPAGGYYGAWSKANPNGYKPGDFKGTVKSYGGKYGSNYDSVLGYGAASESLLSSGHSRWNEGWFDDDAPLPAPAGQSFLQTEDLSEARRQWEEKVWPEGIDANAHMEFMTERDKRIDSIFTEMMGFPEEQWEEYLTTEQIDELEAWGKDQGLPDLNLRPQAVVKETALVPAVDFHAPSTQHATRKERRAAEKSLSENAPARHGRKKRQRVKRRR